MLSIQTNVNSMNAQENLRMTNDFQARTIARLTSGFRINQSGDDAAGLAVANKFRSDIAELSQGVRNANDGLSTMQIIDGGLNNVSKILDRLKTLATQSASSTFTGNRSTLDKEYGDLLKEIDRQAANIGLGSGDTQATRNSNNIQVFIGGGSQAANSKVSVDLTGKSVNQAGLGLVGTNISGNVATVDITDAAVASGGQYVKGGSQTFSFATKTNTYTVTLSGDATDGYTRDEVVQKLNEGLAGSGIGVSVDATTNKLVASSASSFVFSVQGMAGGANAISGAITIGSGTVNKGKYTTFLGTANVAGGSAASALTVTPNGTSAITGISLGGGASAATIENTLKTSLATSGIDVVQLNGAFFLSSDKSFTVSADVFTNAAFGTGTGGVIAAASTPYGNQNTPTASADPTTNSLAALTAIAAAVTTLGNVQGTVGTAQNRLSYAIQLAQSQITNFSAAESRIRDADVAQEAANLTKAQVLSQASMAALAQANSAPQSVLSLLRG